MRRRWRSCSSRSRRRVLARNRLPLRGQHVGALPGPAHVKFAVRAVFWVIAYLGAVVSPLVFAAIGAGHPDHGFWTNFSVALGFVGLAMMGLEFALVARFRPVAAPFGQDALLQFHRQIGYVGLVFILVPSRRSGTSSRLPGPCPRRHWCGSGWSRCSRWSP